MVLDLLTREVVSESTDGNEQLSVMRYSPGHSLLPALYFLTTLSNIVVEIRAEFNIRNENCAGKYVMSACDLSLYLITILRIANSELHTKHMHQYNTVLLEEENLVALETGSKWALI